MTRMVVGIALVAALLLGHHFTLASASSLRVDGGVVQSWELDADIPASEPVSAP